MSNESTQDDMPDVFRPRMQEIKGETLAVRHALYAQAIAAGWLTPDEVRALEGLPPLTNGRGR